VDEYAAGLVRMEIEDYLRGSFLEKAAIVPVSAKTGAGLGELKQALHAAAVTVEHRSDSGFARLPIDRSFAMKGFGTVVTGTLIAGSIGVEEEVELFPGGKRLRVRGVQSGGKSVARAAAGQRTAVNLAGIEHGEIRRGMVLATPAHLRATRRIDVRVQLLASAPVLKQRPRVHFHAGTSATIAEIRLYGQQQLAPNGSAFAQLRLQDETLLLPGDRFIIRQFSPVITIGGGTVLDPLAVRATLRDSGGRITFLEALERRIPEEMFAAMAERAITALTLSEVMARTGWSAAEVHEAAGAAAARGAVKIVAQEPLVAITAARFAELRQKIAARVESFRKENPLQGGIAREVLRSGLGRRIHPEVFRAALQDLIAQKKLEVQGDLVKPAGSQVTLLPEEGKAKEQIEKAFQVAGLAVPAVKEVLAGLSVEQSRAEKLLRILLAEKNLVRVSPELIFHREALSHLKEQLATYRKVKSERISVPVFKELTGITRKYAIPLLEYLDRERMTRRAGDERLILG
jgi:selenocysteine-specific elongation factor